VIGDGVADGEEADRSGDGLCRWMRHHANRAATPSSATTKIEITSGAEDRFRDLPNIGI
jgi:hypothetical protein